MISEYSNIIMSIFCILTIVLPILFSVSFGLAVNELVEYAIPYQLKEINSTYTIMQLEWAYKYGIYQSIAFPSFLLCILIMLILIDKEEISFQKICGLVIIKIIYYILLISIFILNTIFLAEAIPIKNNLQLQCLINIYTEPCMLFINSTATNINCLIVYQSVFSSWIFFALLCFFHF